MIKKNTADLKLKRPRARVHLYPSLQYVLYLLMFWLPYIALGQSLFKLEVSQVEMKRNPM